MDSTKARLLRHFLRLSYPLQVVRGNDGFRGGYPDLPGCSAEHPSLAALYARLEVLRRAWLTEQVQAGAAIAAPNTFLRSVAAPRRTTGRHGGKR